MWISFGTSGGPNSNNISTYVNSPIQILLPVNELEVLRSLSWNITTDDYPVTALIDNDIYNYLQESGANGIKQTCAQIPSIQPVVERILEKGVKEIKELPDMSGNLMGYGDYYNRQEDRTKPHTKYVDEAVFQGEKY
jgi:hypothetical protein